MSSCQDLCTAEKCAELEQRIDELQFKLTELEFKLDGHIYDRVTSAHDFDLNITGILQYDFAANSVRLDLYLVDVTNELMNTAIIQSLPLPFVPEWILDQHIQTSIPEAHSYKPILQVDVFDQPDGSNILKVQIDQVSDEDIFNTEPLQLTIDKTDLAEDFNYQFTVSLGGKSAIANQLIEKAEKFSPEDFIEYLNVQDFYFAIEDLGNNDYSFSITLGDRTREQVLNLPPFGGGGTIQIPPTSVSVNGNYNAENNNLNISVTVDGVSATKSINLDQMPFAEIIACLEEIKLELEKEPETITILASPEVQANIKGTVLVLDFTTVAAFPNLNETKSKWRVQIPAPIENITWDSVKDIRWFRGSQYARMKFTDRSNYMAGWFRSDSDADGYFAQTAVLTSLEVSNIIKPKHSNPSISPQVIETRVYRAFKVFIGENGEPDQSLTEVFKPPTEEE